MGGVPSISKLWAPRLQISPFCINTVRELLFGIIEIGRKLLRNGETAYFGVARNAPRNNKSRRELTIFRNIHVAPLWTYLLRLPEEMPDGRRSLWRSEGGRRTQNDKTPPNARNKKQAGVKIQSAACNVATLQIRVALKTLLASYIKC